jgi:Spy/CpxP family protein refolding chaperone
MTRPRTLLLVLAFVAAALAPQVLAAEDPLAGAFFPPELVMRHLVDIGLDAAQQAGIKQAIGRAQTIFLDRQLDMQTELGKLQALVRPAHVDAAAVGEQLDRVLALEREVKRAQIGLLVEIKNLLRPEQQQRLAALRVSE